MHVLLCSEGSTRSAWPRKREREGEDREDGEVEGGRGGRAEKERLRGSVGREKREGEGGGSEGKRKGLRMGE